MKVIVRRWQGKSYVEEAAIDIDAYSGISFIEHPTTPTAVTTPVVGRCQKMFLSARENAIVVYVEGGAE